MQIVFTNDSVKELFEDLCQITSKNLMRKKIGSELTRKVKLRVDHLRAADNFGMYLKNGLGNPHSLTNGNYGVSLTANYRLIIKPVTDDLSSEALKLCDTVEIKGVEDYHGKGKQLIP